MFIIEAQFNLLLEKYDNIQKFKMKSEHAVQLFENNSFDVIYIDGLHTYEGVKKDIEMWLPKIKTGGYICGHDYESKHFSGVKKAVDEFFKIDETFKDSSWIKKL